MNSLQEFWAGMKVAVPNISYGEIITKTGNPKNTLPPRVLWPNIVKTAVVVQIVRDILGPVIIHSTYRSPEYNRSVGGKRSSLHVQFNAIDFDVRGVDHATVFQLLHDLRDKEVFKGGLGLYSWGCHVDTRGSNADW